jgi:hypothetical protein
MKLFFKSKQIKEINGEMGFMGCYVFAGEGNGKPLLNSKSCLENPL